MFRTFCPAWISLIITHVVGPYFPTNPVGHSHGPVAVLRSLKAGSICEGDATQQATTLGLSVLSVSPIQC